jgi:hypothetical protein
VSNDAAIADLRLHMDRLRGRLFQLVEATGLPKGQQLAIKGCIRNTTYDAQADLEETLNAH